jgi:hypothetical protein
MNNSNSIEKKWDTNWCKRYGKFACDHDVEEKTLKRRYSILLYKFCWESTKQILIWNCLKENLLELFKKTIYRNCPKDNLLKLFKQ